MILWNRDAIEWQAEDTIEVALDAIREHGTDNEAVAAVKDVELRPAQAVTALDDAIREVNRLECPTYHGLRNRLRRNRAA
ncbi:MAG: hypothetical protein ACYC5O_19765 [Anaerolineae bacterium]